MQSNNEIHTNKIIFPQSYYKLDLGNNQITNKIIVSINKTEHNGYHIYNFIVGDIDKIKCAENSKFTHKSKKLGNILNIFIAQLLMEFSSYDGYTKIYII